MSGVHEQHADLRTASRAFLTLLAAVALSACQRPGADSHFETWKSAGAAKEIAEHQLLLRQHGLDQVLPQEQLLRTGRRWRYCNADEFAVPPRAKWPRMLPTLRVVQRLKAEGLMAEAQAASVYRNAALNRCEGGASKSRHLMNNAIDFDLPKSTDNVAQLCAWWRRHGSELKMGLGFYAEDKIHIDTSGFRTWGYDFKRGSSLCVKPRPTS